MKRVFFKSAWAKILISALGALILVSAFAYGALYFQISKIKASKPVTAVMSSDSTVQAAPDISWPEAEKPEKRREYINLLLILQDRRGEAPQNTEGIALMSYNSSAGSIKVVFLVPEMYIKAAGGGRALYGVYALGGLELLKKTVEENFGVYIDGCFETDSGGVKKIVDAAGGLDVNLTAAEAGSFKKNAGQNRLDGAAALEYTRISIADSPFDKTLRQQKALAQYVTKISAFGKSDKLKLLNDMLPSLSTDMTKEKMMGCIFEFAKISGGKVDGGSLIIPENGAYKSITVNKNSLLLPDFAVNRALLKKWVYGS